MSVPTCTRRLEFDAAHRITQHGSKCRNLHGHRYALEITARAAALDHMGMVIDFGAIKRVVGGWVDEHLDHGAILKEDDTVTVGGVEMPFADFCKAQGWKVVVIAGEPTAENLVVMLKRKAGELLADFGIEVERVRLYETPNCWAEV